MQLVEDEFTELFAHVSSVCRHSEIFSLNLRDAIFISKGTSCLVAACSAQSLSDI